MTNFDLKNQSTEKFVEIFENIISEKFSREDSIKILLQINESGYSSHIFSAAVNVLKGKMKKIKAPKNTIDICGTGGDKLNTLNVSTACCFVVAAAGVTVAKHGNKAISSNSGSADIFSEINIKNLTDSDEIERTLNQKKLCFLYAPFFHESLKNLANIRKEIALRHLQPTIFNYLGPLLNPANTKKQIIGVSRLDIMMPIAQFLQEQGDKEVFLVHGFDKMDEITICDNSYFLKVKNDKIYPEEIINPENYQFKKSDISTIQGRDPHYNSQKMLEIFSGAKNAYYDIVVLNSAFALVLAQRCKNIEDAIKKSAKIIDSGQAMKKLRQMQEN